MGATIRDVAELAGVSASTVSGVLSVRSGNARVSPGTAERVRSAAASLNYRPNAAARGLRTAQTQTIGVIARNLLHPFAAELLRSVSAECRARGYHMLVGHAEHDSTEGWVLGDILSADRVDGVLLLGDILSGNKRQERMSRVLKTHRHVVTVSSHPSVVGEPAVLVDNERGVWMALQHLVAQGHQSIGYINQPLGPESWEDQQRRAAYRRFLSVHGLPYTEASEVTATGQVGAMVKTLRELVARPDRPTAVLVIPDAVAVVVIKAAFACGIRVPDDLSVVGFDDIPFAALSSPGLTTVRQPVESMGHFAAGALLDRIAGDAQGAPVTLEPAADATVVFPPTLVVRESVCPRRQ